MFATAISRWTMEMKKMMMLKLLFWFRKQVKSFGMFLFKNTERKSTVGAWMATKVLSPADVLFEELRSRWNLYCL